MHQPDSAGLDIRDLLFQSVGDRTFTVEVRAQSEGVLSGVASLREKGEDIGVTFLTSLPEGAPLHGGTVVAVFAGTPKQIALCEESLIGLVAKYSGVATAAARAAAAAGRIRVVCGAWKKMPGDSKQALRRAVTTGGLPTRLADQNFVYLDKNYVRMLGGIRPTLAAALELGQRVPVIQIRGETAAIAAEAVAATEAGADILMVDTGRIEDARAVSAAVRDRHMRERVRIAFSGGIRIEDLAGLQAEDVDIVDIGRAIIDAPLLDMTLDVVGPYDEPGAARAGRVQ
ncbi:MAG: nicotinate-nucleotide pyrophosphorylase [Dehalococcoidia bacterium]|nr:nicotinate-nucleotide pyrophosphorylase [Dehalococcoidia bacterium]